MKLLNATLFSPAFTMLCVALLFGAAERIKIFILSFFKVFLTKVIERNGRFDKDKTSERKKKILPEEATHFSDAVDKRIWTKYGNLLKIRSGTYVEPRL